MVHLGRENSEFTSTAVLSGAGALSILEETSTILPTPAPEILAVIGGVAIGLLLRKLFNSARNGRPDGED